MHGNIQNYWLNRVLKHSSHLWLESIQMHLFFTILNQFLSCYALVEQLSIRFFSLPIQAEQLFKDQQIQSLKFYIFIFWLKCGNKSSILTTFDFLVSQITSLMRPFLIRQCLAIQIHNFLRQSSYYGLSAYYLANYSLLCSKAKATASPQRYILPQTIICAYAILQFLNKRNPKSRSNQSLPFLISSINQECFSLGLVAQKNIRILCKLRSLLFNSYTQYLRSYIPCTRLLSGIFINPGISLIGLNSRTDLVSKATVFSVSYLKKIWEYLYTTSTTLGSLTFFKYSNAFQYASQLRQCITIIQKLFFLSAKLIRFCILPCDCITKQTSSQLITFKLLVRSSSSSRCFYFTLCTRFPAYTEPPQFYLSALYKRLSLQIMSQISQETSKHL